VQGGQSQGYQPERLGLGLEKERNEREGVRRMRAMEEVKKKERKNRRSTLFLSLDTLGL
jgi:hypothetical protein